jgi:hypothetical protein
VAYPAALYTGGVEKVLEFKVVCSTEWSQLKKRTLGLELNWLGLMNLD